MVWADTMLNGRTELHIFEDGTVTTQRYRGFIIHVHR